MGADPGGPAFHPGSTFQPQPSGKAGKAVGALASEYNPAIVQRAAKAGDMEEGSPIGQFFLGQGKPTPRRADDFLGTVKEGIPGLRNTLPRKDVPEAKPGQTFRDYVRTMPVKDGLQYLKLIRDGKDVPFLKDIPGKDNDAKAASFERLLKADRD